MKMLQIIININSRLIEYIFFLAEKKKHYILEAVKSIFVYAYNILFYLG